LKCLAKFTGRSLKFTVAIKWFLPSLLRTLPYEFFNSIHAFVFLELTIHVMHTAETCICHLHISLSDLILCTWNYRYERERWAFWEYHFSWTAHCWATLNWHLMLERHMPSPFTIHPWSNVALSRQHENQVTLPTKESVPTACLQGDSLNAVMPLPPWAECR